MQKLTETKILELQEKTGHVLGVGDLGDIEALDVLAAKVAGTTKTEARLLSQPFDLCGIAFYPLTVAKSLWFAEKCEEWELEGSQQEACLFWLLTVENHRIELDEYSDRRKSHKAIRELSRRLHCSAQEMTDVYKRCVGIEMNEDGGGEANYGGLIECLLREYGGEPDQWMYETPIAMIETLMNNYSARVNAEQEAARKSAPKSGVAAAPVASERLRALRDFRLKSNEIFEKWSDTDG